MPKKEPVYYSRTRTYSWIEIYLPEHKLAVHHGGEAFFEANEVRYRPTREAAVRTGTAAGRHTAGAKTSGLDRVTRIRTGAKELTDFTLTDNAEARLRKALEKHLKSKEKTQPKQQGAQPSAGGDWVLLPPYFGKGARPPMASMSTSPIAQAEATGVVFEFAPDRQEYSAGDPISIIVHVANNSDHDVLLYPRSTYPSLFDFGILDNGKHVPYTVNMAINSKGKTVRVPANSKILWAKENIVETTKAGDGSSAISAKGKHVLSFGTGNSVELTVK